MERLGLAGPWSRVPPRVQRTLFPLIVLARGASWLDMSVVTALSLIVLVRHLKSLLRVVRGEELGLR